MTEAKQDLIEAFKNPVEQFICDHYYALCKSWVCSDALSYKSYEIKTRSVQLQLKDKCIRKRESTGDRRWYYLLKDEYIYIIKQSPIMMLKSVIMN